MTRSRRTVSTASLALTLIVRSFVSHAQTPSTPLTWHSGGFSGRVSGFLQSELQLREGSEDHVSDDGTRSLNADRFLIRRARVIATIENRWAQLLLELDANSVDGPAVGLQNAEATLRWLRGPEATLPLVALTAGIFRIPFGYQNLQSARDWGFVEPSLAVQAMFPGQSDLGARVGGAVGWLRYQLAVTNGHPVGERGFGQRAPTAPSDLVGRVGVEVQRPTARIQAGLSALQGRGFHPGSPATPDVITYRDINQTGALDPSGLMLTPGQPAVPAQTFSRWAVGVDLVVNADLNPRWRMMAFGEALYAQNLDRAVNVANPVGTSADVRELGWALGTVHTLFNRVVLGVRVDGYDPNADANGRANGRLVPIQQYYLTASFLAGFQVDNTNKILIQYDLIQDHQAIDSAGRPADLKNNLLTVRIQVGL